MDRLALCKIWPDTGWVLKELASQQVEGTVCKICSIVAAKLDPPEPSESISQSLEGSRRTI
jgi:hypothetical protein